MMLDEVMVVSSVEAALYVPALCFSLYNAWRHGAFQGMGWIAIAIYSLIQIAQNILLQMAISAGQSYEHVTSAVGIVSSLGVILLLWASHAFLWRISGEIDCRKSYRISKYLYTMGLFLPICAFLGVSEEWATASPNSPWPDAIRESTLCLFFLVFVGITAVISTLRRMRNWLDLDFRRSLNLLSVCCVPMLARLLYDLLKLYLDMEIIPQELDWLTEDWRLYVAMKLGSEYSMVVLFIVLGFVLPPSKLALSEDDLSMKSLPPAVRLSIKV